MNLYAWFKLDKKIEDRYIRTEESMISILHGGEPEDHTGIDVKNRTSLSTRVLS